jgi:hypothetical protein
MVVPIAPTKILALFLQEEREMEKRERETQRQCQNVLHAKIKVICPFIKLVG